MTIPHDVLAEANAAFDDAYANRCGPDECFKAALAVLSRHWPAADGRLREAAVALDQFAWSSVDTDHPDASANLRTLVGNLRAALSTPAPAENVRVVRVAVARDEAGDFHLKIVVVDDDLAWDWLASMQDAGERLCIAEIPVPIRDVPTVRASVEAGT